MLQLLGILLVLNTLVSAVWWSATSRPWNVGLGALVATALVISLALIFNQRLIEIVLADAAALHASQRKANADAEAIASLRQRMEEDATALRLVLKESAETKRLLAEVAAENRKAIAAAGAVAKPVEGQTASAAPDLRISPDAKPAAPEPMAVAKAEDKPAPEADGKPKEPENSSVMEGKPQVPASAPDQAAALRNHFEKVVALAKAKEYEPAYVSAKECVALYESMEKAGKGARGEAGEVTADGAGAIYSVAGEMAQRAGDHPQALEWGKIAVDFYPSPERKAFLTTAYLNLRKRDEADRIIQEALNQYDPDSIKLRGLLTEFGVIKPPKP